MRFKIATVAALIGVAFLSGACASSEQWAEWRAHTTHFASGDHGMFSLSNNMEGRNPKVTRLDVENSRTQNWWGKTITVEPGVRVGQRVTPIESIDFFISSANRRPRSSGVVE